MYTPIVMNICFSYEEPVQFNIEVTEPGSSRIGEELADYVLAQRVQVGNGSSFYNLSNVRVIYMYTCIVRCTLW